MIVLLYTNKALLAAFLEISRIMSNIEKQRGCQGNICFDCCNELLVATGSGHHVCVDALVKEGADVNGNGTKVLLIKAASGGYSRCIDILIAEGADVNKETMDYMSHTTLSLKPRENRVKCIEILIAAGTNVNLQNRHGKTALHWATFNSRVKCADILLRAGADVNIVDRNGDSVMFELMMDCFPPISKIQQITTKCFRLFLAAGANVNVANNQGETILEQIKKVSLRNLELGVKLLLAAGQTMVQTGPSSSLFSSSFLSSKSVKRVLRSMMEAEPNLKHLCRAAIREHLLHLDPHENLFQRIPRLELPALWQSYLLYWQTLDDDDDDDDDDDEGEEDSRATSETIVIA